jgi:hypothetical protein
MPTADHFADILFLNVAEKIMSSVLWVLLPVLISVGSGLIAVYVMQQRMEVQLARERQSLGEARASIEAHKKTLDELNRARDEASKRRSLDDFLADVRAERTHSLRDKKMLFGERKVLAVRERIYFRDVPLCGWIEHETPVEQGADIENLARSLSVFSSAVKQRTAEGSERNGRAMAAAAKLLAS